MQITQEKIKKLPVIEEGPVSRYQDSFSQAKQITSKHFHSLRFPTNAREFQQDPMTS